MPGRDGNTQIILRPMNLADLDQVVAVDRTSFSTPWPRDAFLYEIKHQRNAISWVVEQVNPGEEKAIIATIVIWLIVDEAHIGTLAVKPGYRRQGIAQKLLAHSLIEAFQRGACRALLEVRESNLAAQRLYRKFGFDAVGVRRNYYKDTHEDAILMTLGKLDIKELAQLADAG